MRTTLLIFSILITSCLSKSNQPKEDSTSPKNQMESVSTPVMLYSFPKQGKGQWRVEDDVVMGGRSNSQLQMTADNYAQFSGRVSLENNGGFCSIHQTVEQSPYQIPDQASAFVVRLKGDGKDYNFRVRIPNGRHFYGFTFSTQGDGNWESISIPFEAMQATYHGEPVNVSNYAGETIVEMQVLIGNKKEETFELLIDSIEVK